jgi:hypothetical protein
MSSKPTILLAAALAAALSLSLTAMRPTTAGPSGTHAQPPNRTTPIQNTMTPAQRRHGTLHGERPGNARLLDEKVSVIVDAEPSYSTDRLPDRQLKDVIVELACGSDAVFIAVPIRGKSFPTEDGRWLFTDYDVELGRVYRMPDVAGFRTGHHVVVSRSGGEMEVEGERVSAYGNAQPRLKPKGRYLMFVKYDSETNAFYGEGAYAAFEVRGSHTYALWSLPTSAGDLAANGVANGAMLGMLTNLHCR